MDEQAESCWTAWRREQAEIGQALARIDKRRRKLIDAQNNLVQLLRAATPFTRQTFSAFYSGGGITAQDWERNRFAYTGVGVVHHLVGNGQLRVVRNATVASLMAAVGAKSADGMDDPPDAA
jgi:hypothetical protein